MTLTESQLKKLANALPNCAIHSENTEEEMQDISFGGVTFKTDVTELNLSGMGLQNISALSSCKELKKLDLSGNTISDLSPLMDIPHLEWLNIANNYVTDLRPMGIFASLHFLNASGNYFFQHRAPRQHDRPRSCTFPTTTSPTFPVCASSRTCRRWGL